MLGIGWQRIGAEVSPLRAIEIAELARSLDPALVLDLDANPIVASRAALAIGRTKDPGGAQPLRAHLSTPDTALRAMCAYGLGLLSDSTALQQLRNLARHDASPAVRYAAVDAIGRIVADHPALAERAIANDLLIVVHSDADASVRGHAAAQFDAFRAGGFANDIESSLERALANENDERVRWHVMWTIARSYATLADRTLLANALHDANEVVRLEAARAWGRRTDPDAASVVSVALTDRSWRVQYEAREALRRIKKLGPTEHLTAIPEGINLPPIPPAAVPSVAAPGPAPTGLTAPSSGTLDLETFDPPTTALEMNGGRPGPHVRAIITTTKGDITVTLYREWAPSTVANFLDLARRHYFDGNRWFRVVPDFVAQTGDPSDNGEGDAGYMIPAEENPVEERSGVIAMGLNYDKNVAERDSAGTQFYITMSPQLHLDRAFTVFGEVTKGFDILGHLVESDRIVRITEVPIP
jgi:peptidyl-prolyl cis-trans isomerase B (cyclophilin B)